MSLGQVGSENLAQAWLDAAADLGIEVAAPFELRVNDDVLYCTALVRDFGAPRGMLVLSGGVPEWADARRLLDAASELRYGYSYVGTSYARYDRNLFIDTLNDWGWQPKGEEPPGWYSGEPWSA